jgi:parallel beta-helix repeat protein
MVQGCSNAIIQSNTLTDNSGHGLEIDWSTTVTAVDNYIFGNRDEGIYAYDCQNCTLTGNFVSGNHWSGVLIQSGNGNVIINNTISNNDHVGGIWLFDGTASNTVSGNTILNNSRGVYIGFWTTYYSSPQGNLIVNNTLEGNSIGINIDYSNANAVYHNQIVGNDAQSTVKPGYSNVWDNGCEGNYWSDYNGTDSNGDGIGDTPYVIDANNVDNYPLMNVYWNPCDINHDLKVNMKDIGRSARAFGTVPGDTLWNPHADITGPQYLVPDNKVDMRDIGLIARHFGEHL